MKSVVTKRIEQERETVLDAINALEQLPHTIKSKLEIEVCITRLEIYNDAFWHILAISTSIDEEPTQSKGTVTSVPYPKFEKVDHDAPTPMIVDAVEVRPTHIDTPVFNAYPSGLELSYVRSITPLTPVGLEGEDWPFRKNSDMQQYKHVWKNILTLWLTRDVMLKSRYPELFKLAKDKGYTYDKAQHFTILESKLPDDRLVVLTQMYLAAKRDEGKEVINDVSPLEPHEKELKEFIANLLQGAKDLRDYPSLLYAAMQYDAARSFSNTQKVLVPEVLSGLPIEHLLKMYDALMKDEGHE